ncbi:MAG: PEP-CTERM system histidine kinase PrsK [Burkholderiales bacterium]|nr:PEP-CTERM system histidine kinase PrsK [Burkholderiales bacterium]
MAEPFSSPAVWSFGLGLVAFALFGLRLGIGWRRGRRAMLLLAAVVASALWEAASLGYALWQTDAWWLSARVTDAARIAAWIAFLLALFAEATAENAAAGAATPGRKSPPLWIGALAGVLIVASLITPQSAPMKLELPSAAVRTGFAFALTLPILGLLVVEQLFRGTPRELRWNMKPLYLGLGGVFAFDLFLHADALLFGHLNAEVWAARGIVNALAIPFVAVAAARSRDWSLDMHVSRDVVFHSTALLISGVYLLGVAAAGYWVRYFGGTWGTTVQVAFLFAALLTLGALLSSGSMRARLRVFISKHFFSYRYNYREEWLKVTRLLSAAESEASLNERCVRALGDLVESTGGSLFLKRQEGFAEAARWNTAEVAAIEPATGSLVRFLERTGWVVNLEEHRGRAQQYEDLVLPEWLDRIARAWLIVPLHAGEELIGFAVLAEPRTPVEVNWEVRDLLKTAARQAASYVGQVRAAEALLEAQKFDAFNRMSAFVVHDLKNLVAQLSLLLKNAERHQDKPEFRKDMLSTVEHVVGRMNRLLLQLRAGTTPVEAPRAVSLTALAERIGRAKATQKPSVTVEAPAPVLAFGHEDRLERVIGHLVQNALEATPSDGQVALRVHDEGEFAVIEVSDTGVGMSAEFVRERLFKPFQSTKQTGMGIGAYESAQYVGELGGRILVDSRPQAGTRVRVFLPRAGALRSTGKATEERSLSGADRTSSPSPGEGAVEEERRNTA